MDVFFTQPVLDFRIVLEAKNPDRRCFRQYRVEAGTDLFGVWVDEGEARHLARSILNPDFPDEEPESA